MDLIGLSGIVVSMILLLFLTYRGFNIVYTAPVCALLVIVSNKIPFSEITNSYLEAIGRWLPTGFFYAILGSVLGKIYEDSGAAESIGRKLITIFTAGKNVSQNHRALCGLLAVFLMQMLMTCSGISGTVVMLTSFPLAKAIARDCNIPRRLLPGIVCGGAISATMAAPGLPQIGNIMASSILGTKPIAGLFSGIIGSMLVLGFGLIYIYCEIKKAFAAGKPFVTSVDDVESVERKLPPTLLAIIPLIMVLVVYTVLGFSIAVSMTVSTVLAMIFLSPYIAGCRMTGVKQTLQKGAQTGTYVFFLLSSTMGFAAVVQATPAFMFVSNILQDVASRSGSPFTVASIVVFFTLITASPPASLLLGLPIFIPSIQQGILSANAVHRIGVFATTTFESMPYSGAALVSIQISGTTHKEGYLPMFICTVLIPFAATYILAFLFSVFPKFSQI
jgi:H+/gluconate symporter-like permease